MLHSKYNCRLAKSQVDVLKSILSADTGMWPPNVATTRRVIMELHLASLFFLLVQISWTSFINAYFYLAHVFGSCYKLSSKVWESFEEKCGGISRVCEKSAYNRRKNGYNIVWQCRAMTSSTQLLFQLPTYVL